MPINFIFRVHLHGGHYSESRVTDVQKKSHNFHELYRLRTYCVPIERLSFLKRKQPDPANRKEKRDNETSKRKHQPRDSSGMVTMKRPDEDSSSAKTFSKEVLTLVSGLAGVGTCTIFVMVMSNSTETY